jgi:hypothetical protein
MRGGIFASPGLIGRSATSLSRQGWCRSSRRMKPLSGPWRATTISRWWHSRTCSIKVIRKLYRRSLGLRVSTKKSGDAISALFAFWRETGICGFLITGFLILSDPGIPFPCIHIDCQQPVPYLLISIIPHELAAGLGASRHQSVFFPFSRFLSTPYFRRRIRLHMLSLVVGTDWSFVGRVDGLS